MKGACWLLGNLHCLEQCCLFPVLMNFCRQTANRRQLPSPVTDITAFVRFNLFSCYMVSLPLIHGTFQSEIPPIKALLTALLLE